MSQFIEVIKSRKSIRRWLGKKVPRNLVKEVIECGMAAPSAFSSHPFNLIAIDDKKKIQGLLKDRLQLKSPPYWINSTKWAKKSGLENYEKLKNPPLLIIVTGNLKKCPDVPSMIQTLAASSENVLLACHALRLGACWLYVYDPDLPETESNVRIILDLSKDFFILSMIAIGYPKI